MQPFSEKNAPDRTATESPSLRTWGSVAACLEHDHRLMDAILTDVDVFANQRDWRAAAAYFAQFRARITAHMAVEEEIVFPIFQRATGYDGPVAVMLREHEQIRRLLAAVEQGLSGAEASADPLAALAELGDTLDRHDEKEERVIYPAVDAHAGSADQLPGLVARIEAFLERGRT